MGLDNPLHIAFLVVILLLVFGAKRLPEIGRSIGSGMREFKHGVTGETPPQQPALNAPPAAAATEPAKAQPAQAPAQPATAQPATAPAQTAVPAQPAVPAAAPAPGEPEHAGAEPPA